MCSDNYNTTFSFTLSDLYTISMFCYVYPNNNKYMNVCVYCVYDTEYRIINKLGIGTCIRYKIN